MQYSTKYIKRIREIFIDMMSDLTLEELNEIPAGFNNNIAWNFGHIVCSTPALCYIRSGVAQSIDNPYFEKYKNGSKPESFITAEELEILKTHAFSTLEKIEKDLEAGVFQHIVPYATLTFKYEMGSIEEILTCVSVHESMHLGIARTMKRIIKSQAFQAGNNLN